ncbi:MAG: hypothetical protein KF862_17575 [Chitinophagaceae bacterium]|nr:hypothetical protein [Chitinophagaceae bacterium]
MHPAQVWLNLIPVFNLVWQFITVNTYKNLILANRDNFLLDAEREMAQQ